MPHIPLDAQGVAHLPAEVLEHLNAVGETVLFAYRVPGSPVVMVMTVETADELGHYPPPGQG